MVKTVNASRLIRSDALDCKRPILCVYALTSIQTTTMTLYESKRLLHICYMIIIIIMHVETLHMVRAGISIVPVV